MRRCPCIDGLENSLIVGVGVGVVQEEPHVPRQDMSRPDSPDLHWAKKYSIHAYDDDTPTHDAPPSNSAAIPEEAARLTSPALLTSSLEQPTTSSRFADSFDGAPYITHQQAQAIHDEHASGSHEQPGASWYANIPQEKAETMEDNVASPATAEQDSPGMEGVWSDPPISVGDVDAFMMSRDIMNVCIDDLWQSSSKRQCDSYAEDANQRAGLLSNTVLQDINAGAAATKRRRADPPLDQYPAESDSEREPRVNPKP